MATNKADNEKQFMDVQKPGKSTPDASAKPVIVGHKPLVQDPMVNSDANPEATNPETENEQPVQEVTTGKRVIEPITHEEETQEAEADQPTETNEQAIEKTDAEAQKDENTTASDSNDAAVVDAVIDQVDNKKQDEISEEDRKKQEALDKLVDEKKYFVPIGKAHGGSSKLLLVFVILLLVVFVGLIAAIDAGLLDVGLQLPFDLI